MLLRNKIFISFSILVIIPLIIVGGVVQNKFTSSKSEEVITKTENTIIQLNYNLDLMLEDASRSTLSLLYNEQLLNILREYEISHPVIYKNYNHANLFSLFLSGITFNKDQIYGVHVFTNNGQVFSHMDDFRIENYINLHRQQWYVEAKRKEGGWITYYDEDPIYYKDNEEEYVSFLRLLRDPDNHQELGIMKIDFSPKYLEEVTKQVQGEHWQISTRDHTALIGSNSGLLLSRCQSNRSWIKDETSNQEYLCVTHTSNKTGFKISNVISKDFLYREIKEFNHFFFYFIGICLLVALAISYYMANHLLKPLELLKDRIRLFQQDKLSNNNHTQSKDEIRELHLAYDGMLSDIDYLVSEVYEINLRSSEAEYKALQAQMDPHFIFNTLESINMKAIRNNQLQISDMIAELGKLIRYRLKNEEQQILLKEEIIFAKLYINIMKNRLEDALNVYWILEEGAVDCLVPKYIIQPLIENSIMHGYNQTIKKIYISIKIRKKKDMLKITVSDNGSGIEPEKLNRIQNLLKQSSLNKNYESRQEKSKNGIALLNINRRLRLIHGINSRLLISSVLDQGTKVDIIIKE